MERFSARVIDELGRYMLHHELRRKLCLEKGNKLLLTHVDTIVVIQRVTEEAMPGHMICEIDDLGTITLPSELRNSLHWKEADKISTYHVDNLIILTKARDN